MTAASTRLDSGVAKTRTNLLQGSARRKSEREYPFVRSLGDHRPPAAKPGRRHLLGKVRDVKAHAVCGRASGADPGAPGRVDDHFDHDRRDERGRYDGHHAYHDFHGHDFRFFTPYELDLWRHGGWVHDWYGGRYGWWWVADGYWYWYPQPVYSYPTYVPPVPPPAGVVTPGAPLSPAMPPPAPGGQVPPQFWYYCAESRAYYPSIANCNTPWQPVPTR